jgi:hypothetical protein
MGVHFVQDIGNFFLAKFIKIRDIKFWKEAMQHLSNMHFNDKTGKKTSTSNIKELDNNIKYKDF